MKTTAGQRMCITSLFLFCLFCSALASAKSRIEIGKIKTRLGTILIFLYPQTPKHQASFLQLAKAGYWNSLSFNRVIPDFVAQGGCPDTEAGFTDSAYLLAPEFDPAIKHGYGAVGAGRDDNAAMYSARCQFYIVQAKNGIPRLDGRYTVFGHVIRGMEVVEKIVYQARDNKDEPFEKVNLKIGIRKINTKRLQNFNLPSYPIAN